VLIIVLGFFTLTVVIYAISHGVHGVGAGDFKPTWAIFIAAVPVLFFNYVGFELPSAAGDEMKDPQKDVPHTVLRAFITSVLLYVLPILAVVIYGRTARAGDVSIVDEPTLHLLRAVPAFAELPLTAIERLADGLVPASYPAGSALMEQGEEGREFIVIAGGEVEILVDGRPVQRLGPGTGVGEIALLRRSPRTATVIARTDVTGYRVDCAIFNAAIAGPAAAAVTERIAAAHLERSATPMPETPAPSPVAG